MPVMFIVKTTPGGTIDANELATYPDGHFYQVQKNAWMDRRIWADYLSRVIEYTIFLSTNTIVTRIIMCTLSV